MSEKIKALGLAWHAADALACRKGIPKPARARARRLANDIHEDYCDALGVRQ
jgi:hypothetical protein